MVHSSLNRWQSECMYDQYLQSCSLSLGSQVASSACTAQVTLHHLNGPQHVLVLER